MKRNMAKILQIVPAPKRIDSAPLIYNETADEPVLFLALLADGTLRAMRGMWLPKYPAADYSEEYCAGFELARNNYGKWDELREFTGETFVQENSFQESSN